MKSKRSNRESERERERNKKKKNLKLCIKHIFVEIIKFSWKLMVFLNGKLLWIMNNVKTIFFCLKLSVFPSPSHSLSYYYFFILLSSCCCLRVPLHKIFFWTNKQHLVPMNNNIIFYLQQQKKIHKKFPKQLF